MWQTGTNSSGFPRNLCRFSPLSPSFPTFVVLTSAYFCLVSAYDPRYIFTNIFREYLACHASNFTWIKRYPFFVYLVVMLIASQPSVHSQACFSISTSTSYWIGYHKSIMNEWIIPGLNEWMNESFNSLIPHGSSAEMLLGREITK